MTLGEVVTYVFIGLSILDFSLWLLVVRTPRTSGRWKPRVRNSLGVLVLALVIVGADSLKMSIWDLRLPDGAMVPALFLIVCLQSYAGMVGWIALIRPNG